MKISQATLVLLCLALFACNSSEGTPGQSETQGAETDASGNPAVQTEWTWTASNAGQFWAAWRPTQGPVEMGPSFAIEIRLASEKAGPPLDLSTQQIAIGARMPEHQHGMLQTTEITRLAPGHYRIEGLRFHMLGYWQLHLDISQPPITERAQFDIRL